MTVKDVMVSIQLYDGQNIGTIWMGRAMIGAGGVVHYCLDGKADFLQKINRYPFIELADRTYNVKEIKSVSFGEETEREVE